jgi:type IV pilus biogenesis protein CpaD/CtpE|tara:strand:- start:158 stop:316 length:159 start_codon:yes stop_codon:yes gene_type:complete
MKIFLFLTMLYVISACALESNTTMTTIPEEVVPEEVIVIKETKACTDEGTCK